MLHAGVMPFCSGYIGLGLNTLACELELAIKLSGARGCQHSVLKVKALFFLGGKAVCL